ncbi:MAG: hypothetical protein ACSLE3_05590 [Microbacteriaceae bacterium]|jgi:predicted transcriptional regulator
MPATTIKVSSDLRDRLNDEARRSGVPVAAVIEGLLAERDRLERFRRLRAERATHRPDERTDALEDASWESAGLGSLSSSDG